MIAQGLAFLYARLRDKQPVRLPGAVGFYLGAVIATLVLASHRFVCVVAQWIVWTWGSPQAVTACRLWA